MPPLSDRTRLIASATRRGQGRRPVNPPIERASTMLSDDPASMQSSEPGPVYGLDGTSAARELRLALADLEGASDAFLVPSGLAAVTVPLLALLEPGDEIIASDAVYGPTRRFITRYLANRGVTSHFHDPSASTEQIAALFTAQTRVLLIESPASLTFEILDVPALAKLCIARGVTTVMDNTWAAGLAFKPLQHGVDISAQALTKYVGGHSDILMGGITVTDAVLSRRIQRTIEDMGWHVSPDDAWLALRGLRTLPLRYGEQLKSALVVADWLKRQTEVEEVLFPPLPGSVGHVLWSRDYSGGAALIGIVLKDGDKAAAHRLMSALGLYGMGYSWGGFESLITHETPQLNLRVTPPMLAGQLLRLHIGLEDPKDLIADFRVGLDAWRRLG